MRQKQRSISKSIGIRAFEQLAAVGIVFFLTPYLQAQLAPLRDKVYGPNPPGTPPNPGSTLLPPALTLNPTIPNVQAGTVPLPMVSNPTGSPPTVTPPVVGDTPSNVLNITQPLAPTGDQPAPAGGPALAPNGGPLGGLFLGT